MCGATRKAGMTTATRTAVAGAISDIVSLPPVAARRWRLAESNSCVGRRAGLDTAVKLAMIECHAVTRP
jgi:hypothetical protein